MEIPLKAQVVYTDGVCGRSVYVLVNPVIDQVTHVVVKEDSSPNTKYTVFLKIDKHQIEALPTILVKRRWS